LWIQAYHPEQQILKKSQLSANSKVMAGDGKPPQKKALFSGAPFNIKPDIIQPAVNEESYFPA
jgi:hypothetical protein